MVLAWADDFFERNGRWPTREDGLIHATGGETWTAVEVALNRGLRGLPNGLSLARLRCEHRGVRNIGGLPPLTIEQILTWADAHHARTGRWPAITSGPIDAAAGETWSTVEHALLGGRRGLPRGGSLAQLLDAHRGTRRTQNTTPLTERQILSWADAWHKRHGAWPITESGDIPESKGDTWNAVCVALRQGYRGLRGGMSLAQFLAVHRGVRNLSDVPPLSEEQILSWADAHFARHGRYPTQRSGAVEDAPGETWGAIGLSLILGRRGLRGGDSLARLFAAHRGVRNRLAAAALSEDQILAWADSYFARHGKWPTQTSGPIDEAPGEMWRAIAWALRKGRRGLPGGSSLTDLFLRHRRKANRLVSCVSATGAEALPGDRGADECRPAALTDRNGRKRPRIRSSSNAAKSERA